MSGTSHENDDDDENDEFQESLDRILSSSYSSTSNSDDSDGTDHRRLRSGDPVLAVSYDAWIADPSTVEERRRSLLRQMGLADDPALARRRSSPPRGERFFCTPPPEPEVKRSVSCDVIYGQDLMDPALQVSPVIVQSRSLGRVGHEVYRKPPLVARLRSKPDDREESVFSEEEELSDPRFLIRNLDDGKEFLVREDGSWDRVKDVSTGQHLTMDEFDTCVGRSPIVQELMRRQSIEGSVESGNSGNGILPCPDLGSRQGSGSKQKKKRGWFRSIKNVAGSVVTGGSNREWRSSDEKDTSSEKGGGRRSSSATDDSQDGPQNLPEKIKVRQYGKTHKEFTALYLNQEIRAHKGSIWSIKFSLDGRFLASAGEDCVVHVWQVSEYVRKEDLYMEKGLEECRNGNSFFKAFSNGSSDFTLALASAEGNHSEKKRGKVPSLRKPLSSEHLIVPENVFALSEKPVCSFEGHHADVLDLSWSKSQYLLSSSMDKTVRLWHISSATCLKTFSHSDYVTCIQFNPVDDRYFISGSLDEKVRLWSVPDRQVVDWNDIHEMVTAACYTPDGKGAFVGSHKGSCYLYDAADNKLQLKCQVDLQNKKKRSNQKKITGFQFAPGSSSELLVTSADSRIRVIDGSELVHKFKGFRNTSSQISASFTTKGDYVVCAGEDSQVYIWGHETDSRTRKSKGLVSVTQSYEYFQCQDVTVAAPWPRCGCGEILRSSSSGKTRGNSTPRNSDSSILQSISTVDSGDGKSTLNTIASRGDRGSSTTWPEDNLVRTPSRQSPRVSIDTFDCTTPPTKGRSAWGLVIVTAGRGGDIKTYQNFGFPIRV